MANLFSSVYQNVCDSSSDQTMTSVATH